MALSLAAVLAWVAAVAPLIGRVVLGYSLGVWAFFQLPLMLTGVHTALLIPYILLYMAVAFPVSALLQRLGFLQTGDDPVTAALPANHLEGKIVLITGGESLFFGPPFPWVFMSMSPLTHSRHAHPSTSHGRDWPGHRQAVPGVGGHRGHARPQHGAGPRGRPGPDQATAEGRPRQRLLPRGCHVRPSRVEEKRVDGVVGGWMSGLLVGMFTRYLLPAVNSPLTHPPTLPQPNRKGDLSDLDDVGAFSAAFLRKLCLLFTHSTHHLSTQPTHSSP